MKNELNNYTKEELNKILKSVNEMITIPIVNKWGLKKENLIKMKNRLESELLNK
tara:strand:+ start:955 stop:1116 length:162 start_codon:yes stop_codon:yes gene_type:complete